jgi:hypothetical protein
MSVRHDAAQSLHVARGQAMNLDPTDDGGLACDGNRVVINLRKYRFPDRCLITGEPVEGEQPPVLVHTWSLFSQQPDAKDCFHDVIRSSWNLGPLHVDCVALCLPLLARFRNRSSGPAVLFVVLGAAVAVVGLILAVIGAIAWQWPILVAVVPVIVGLGMVAASVRALTRRQAPLSIQRMFDGHVWLNGVHPGVRDALPTWRNSVAEIAHRKRVIRGSLGFGVVALIVGAIQFFIWGQELADALASRDWLSTEGTISSSQVVAHESGGNRGMSRREEYEVHASYSFRVQGATYSGNRISFGASPKSRLRRNAENLRKRYYGAGQAVKVYFHASDPSRCSLSPATANETLGIAAFPSLAVAVGAGSLLYCASIAWRARRAEK